MIKLKNLVLGLFFVFALSLVSFDSKAQGFAPGKGFKQLNFGLEFDGFGLPLYIGGDFGVSEMITVGPRLMVMHESDNNRGTFNDWSATIITPSFRGDYHWSGHIDDLPKEFDFYAGASLGIEIFRSRYEDSNGSDVSFTDSDIAFWIQIGGRYYFSPKWGVNLELSTYGTNGSLGVSYKL